MRHPRGGRASQRMILEETGVLKISLILSRCKLAGSKVEVPQIRKSSIEMK